MVVDSGGKSLHTWLAVAHSDEAEIDRYMRYAESIGADSAGRVPSQYFRMPHGTRYKDDTAPVARQQVLYINPTVLESNKRK